MGHGVTSDQHVWCNTALGVLVLSKIIMLRGAGPDNKCLRP